jgi:hypothetical protein
MISQAAFAEAAMVRCNITNRFETAGAAVARRDDWLWANVPGLQ